MKKDDPFDRLLQRAARPLDSARVAGDCLDAETLAAWADGSLTSAQRQMAELHAADCDRCLAMVAALAKTAPPPVEVQRSSWFSLRWLVPITTAIVVVGVWALVQSRPEEKREVALNTPPPPAIDAVTPAPAAPPPPVQERGISPQAPTDAPAAKKAQPTLAARSRQTSAQAPKRDEESKKRELRQGQTAADRATAPAASPTPLPPAAPASPVVPPPLVSTQSSARTAETVANAGAGGGARGGGAAQGARGTSVVVQSPDPNVLWRFPGIDTARMFRDALAAPALAKSLDGGRTWTPQPIGSSFEALRAGAAPAPNVCWLVGRSGTVLLTTNGTTWQQVPFPDLTADLVAVTARDALSATVTTADGRTYQTDDGGKTWRLQENPAAAF